MDDQDNEIDDSIAVELLNNAEDDQLSIQDAERQSTTTAGGCLSTATIIVAVVIFAALAFSQNSEIRQKH